MHAKEDYLILLRSYFHNKAESYGIVRMALFGSVARNEQTGQSDIDIAYEGEANLLLRSRMKQELEELKQNKYTIIFYEAPHRIEKTLKNILEIFGNRQIAIVREISKKYEEIIRGSIQEIINNVQKIKGEIVIVIEGNREVTTYENLSIEKHVELYIEDGMTTNDAIKKVAKERNLPKSEVYTKYHNI